MVYYIINCNTKITTLPPPLSHPSTILEDISMREWALSASLSFIKVSGTTVISYEAMRALFFFFPPYFLLLSTATAL